MTVKTRKRAGRRKRTFRLSGEAVDVSCCQAERHRCHRRAEFITVFQPYALAVLCRDHAYQLDREIRALVGRRQEFTRLKDGESATF